MSAVETPQVTVGTEPLRIANVLVPLSSSASSEAALAPASELARRFGARVHLLAVGIEREEADVMAERLSVLAPGVEASVHARVHWEVPASIIEVAGDEAPSVVCMASHARGRLGELVLGSYTTPLVAESPEPVLLVGPEHEAKRGVADGPVLACVDGSDVSEQILPVAARWAQALDVGLRVVTVAEPVGDGLDDRPAHRAHAPDGDPQAYVDAVAAPWQASGLDVSGLVVYDPIGAAEGLAAAVHASPCGLLAVTTHARTGLRRAVFGSQAAAILRQSAVPVLTVRPAGR